MQRIIITIATGLILVPSCAPTGDWNQDTILFSPKLGDERLAEMHLKLNHIQGQTYQYKKETEALKESIVRATASRSASQSTYASLRSRITALEYSLAESQKELDTIKGGDRDIHERVSSLEKTIATESAEVAKLRSILIIATQ